MASNQAVHTFPIILLIVSVINTTVVNSAPESELNAMMAALGARGYNLFANAIATSDIRYDILTGGNFTFFAPIDSALFALDMTVAASDYVTTLRLHVVPRLLSLADLRRLPSGSNLIPTLMPGQDILVEQRRAPWSQVTVDGVDIVVPGLFYGRDLAVHGLEGILSFRLQRNIPWNITGNSPSNFTGNQTLRSPITSNLANNHTSPTPTRVHRHAHSPPPPLTFNLTKNHKIASHAPVSPPLLSNLTRNHTVASPVTAPTTSVVSPPDIPPANRISMPSAPTNHQPDNSSPSAEHSARDEHRLRARLSELTPDGEYQIKPAAGPTSNVLEEFTPVDSKTVDCRLTDEEERLKIANIRHGYLFARELYTTSTMICAQR